MRSERGSSASASPRLFSAEDDRGDWPENLELSLTPAGKVQLLAPGGAPAEVSALASAFSQSTADGLLRLVAQHSEEQLPTGLLFWRSLGQRYFHTASQLGEEVASRWESIDPPSPADFQALIAAAPPMRGLEYLTPQLLARLWDELHSQVVAQAKKHPQGAVEYLRSISPNWRLLGRVTFHLAENKRDESRPFAFLATYAHRLAAGARLQHLPLGQALLEYAGAKDQARLAALLEPVRRAAETCPLVRELLDSRALFQPQAWTIGQAYRFLTDLPKLEAAGLVARVPNWWNAKRPTRPQVQVRLGEQRDESPLGLTGLLDFSAELALEGEPLTAAERKQLLAAQDGLLLLRGKWVEVNRDQLNQALTHWQQLQAEHASGVTFIQGMRMLAGAAVDASAEDALSPDWSRVVAGDWLRETLQTLRDPSGLAQISPGVDLYQAALRPYQADGVRWLWFLTHLNLGACLADDMGLGKTIQIIDLLLQLKRAARQPAAAPKVAKRPAVSEAAPSLLVAPASLIGNWKQELRRFAPQLRVFFAHRSETDAAALDQIAGNPQLALADYDLVVTTYGLVRRAAWLRQPRWRLAILDEAQAVKNASSAQAKAVKGLQAGGRIVLTGTPVENHLGDLWSLFDFCNPGLLGSAAEFKKYVGRLNKRQDASAFGALRKLVQPYILRRLKSDPKIVPDLPDKTELRTECGLAKKQAVLYEAAVEDLAKQLKRGPEGMARKGLVLSTLLKLKQICNHPAQYLGQNDFTPADSGKFARLADICEPIAARQERALVFTQFQSLCEPLADYLATLFGQPGLVLHGKTPVAKRSQLVRTFQAEGGPPFLVISVKAGGAGLNLTAASHVIHFDRWWNPAVENQATDRAFRIGQKKNVLVHKFVCRGTVEERIDELILGKKELVDKLLSDGGETKLTELSDSELLRMVSLDLNRSAADE